jgi:hypothetical protein
LNVTQLDHLAEPSVAVGAVCLSEHACIGDVQGELVTALELKHQTVELLVLVDAANSFLTSRPTHVVDLEED